MSKTIIALMAGSLLSGVCFAAAGGAGGAEDPERRKKIRTALRQLDTKTDDEWTNGGLPSMETMKEITKLDDLTRDEVGRAHPGFNRSNAHEMPADDEPAKSKASTAPADPEGEQLNEAVENAKPNSDPETNPNVGRTDLGPYEGQMHTADQRPNLAAELKSEEVGDTSAPADADPIALLEQAVAAGSTDRYRRNGALQNLIRAYQIEQVNIKDTQKRLDLRNDRRAAEAKDAEARAG